MLEQIRTYLKGHLPSDLVDFFLNSYKEIKENYLLERNEPSELNGGKLVEACYRILQQETTGSFTAPGVNTPDMIGKLRAFEQLGSTAFIESFRIHIPRTLATIYNIRNKRGVGHLSGDVNPNQVDATLISACADWVLAEFLRIYYSCSLNDAQKMVDAISVRPTFLVHEVVNLKRVLNPDLKQKDQVLILLASSYPNSVSDENLIKWEAFNTKRQRR